MSPATSELELLDDDELPPVASPELPASFNPSPFVSAALEDDEGAGFGASVVAAPSGPSLPGYGNFPLAAGALAAGAAFDPAAGVESLPGNGNCCAALFPAAVGGAGFAPGAAAVEPQFGIVSTCPLESVNEQLSCATATPAAIPNASTAPTHALTVKLIYPIRRQGPTLR